MSSTNLMIEMVETSKNLKVEVRDHVTPGLGSVLISDIYTVGVSISTGHLCNTQYLSCDRALLFLRKTQQKELH